MMLGIPDTFIAQLFSVLRRGDTFLKALGRVADFDDMGQIENGKGNTHIVQITEVCAAVNIVKVLELRWAQFYDILYLSDLSNLTVFDKAGALFHKFI